MYKVGISGRSNTDCVDDDDDDDDDECLMRWTMSAMT
jgi:hypothetical protein